MNQVPLSKEEPSGFLGVKFLAIGRHAFFGFGVVLGRRRWGCLNGGLGKEKEEMGIALIKLYTRINNIYSN